MRIRPGTTIGRAVFFVIAVGAAAVSADIPSASRERPLLKDTRFERGFTYYGTEPSRKGAQVFSPIPTSPPVWGLSQWWSKYPLTAASFQKKAAGYALVSEGVCVAAEPGAEGLLTLIAYGQKEWEDGVRGPQDAWPHLLLEQRLVGRPLLQDLVAVRLRMDARVLRCDARNDAAFDPRRHAARFRINFTVQNRNATSPGFGDYYWFIFTLFDNRYEFQREKGKLDAGSEKKKASGKYIYVPDMRPLMRDKTLHKIGTWVEIDADILPALKAGWAAARKQGFLADSGDFADYGLNGFNVGYELTGAFDMEAQIRNLNIIAVKK